MSWYRKRDATPFDQLPIVGLCFMDGDVVSREIHSPLTAGMKFPLIAFPSGVTCEVWNMTPNPREILVHLFGEMDLLLYSDRDAGFRLAFALAEQVGYGVKNQGDNELEVVGDNRDDHFIITYDNRLNVMLDVRHAPQPTVAPPPPLLDEQSRARLPPLYSGEQTGLGMEAIAQVKFFSPKSGWTWYASEGSLVDADSYFDTDEEKVDFLFFGLVIGYEIEVGYFSLSELTHTRGLFGLSVERDKDYQPKTLRELQEQHRNERRNG